MTQCDVRRLCVALSVASTIPIHDESPPVSSRSRAVVDGSKPPTPRTCGRLRNAESTGARALRRHRSHRSTDPLAVGSVCICAPDQDKGLKDALLPQGGPPSVFDGGAAQSFLWTDAPHSFFFHSSLLHHLDCFPLTRTPTHPYTHSILHTHPHSYTLTLTPPSSHIHIPPPPPYTTYRHSSAHPIGASHQA